MSLLTYQPDLVLRPRPQPNQVDEWQVVALNYDFQRSMRCRLTLGCGHQIPLATSYRTSSGLTSERIAADREAKRSLDAAVKQHADAHDCAAYVRQRQLAAVTARLKE